MNRIKSICFLWITTILWLGYTGLATCGGISPYLVDNSIIADISEPSDVDVNIPKGKDFNPNGVALVIGIEKYKNVSNALYGDRDAITFRQYLIDLFGFKEENIVLLLNDEATKGGISRGLRQLSDWCEPTSEVIVYYAGHGLPTADDKQQFLMPYDGDPNYLDDTGYSLRSLYERLSKMPAKSVTVFLDACFSGTDRDNNLLIIDARPIFRRIEGLSAYRNLAVLCATTGVQIASCFKEKKHGLFTYYLLKGMRGEANTDNNREITLGELAVFVKENVSTQARRMGREQTPAFIGNKEQVLVRQREPTLFTPPRQITTRPRFFADLDVSNPRFVEPSGNRALDAEERGRIAFTLENRGRGTAEEVEVSLVLLTDTTHLTYPKTTQLGSLASEAKKEVEIPVTTGLDVADGTATFRIAVSEKWGFEPDPFTVTFDTKAFVPPQLVINDANIGIDDDKQGDSYGDNDSKIELKETVEVTVAVQNKGAGDAEDVKAEVTIEGEGRNIYYNSPSAIFELGNIPAGDYKQFTFAFSTNNRYKRKDLPITVNITESKGKYGLTKPLGLTVDTPIRSSRDVVVTKIEQPQLTVTPTAPQLTSLANRTPTNAIPQFSDAVAVIFGIEEYRFAPPATFANRDATIFYDYAKTVFGIPERNIHLATNELATKGTFDKVFGEDGWIERRVTPNETEVFIFYSGHGAPTTDKSAYIIPQDADPNYAKTTGLALNQLYESLNKLKAKHVTIFIDACFSGSGRPIEKEQKPMLLADARPVFVTVEGPLAYGNMTVMTASTGAQISSGYPDQKHGLFTFYLLMGLYGEADLNGDKAVTVGELGNYLEQHIPDKALELYDREQNPTVQTNEAERVMVQFK